MSRRGLLIALIVSLALNVFVLGGLAGALLMGVHPPGGPPPGGPPRLAAMGEALSPAHRQAWEQTLKTAVGISRPKLQQARALRRQGWQALAANPADPAAALLSLNQSRLLEAQARGEMDQAVVGFVATLPADERGRLTDKLSRARPPGPGGGGGRPWSGGLPGPDRDGLPLPKG